MKGQKLEMIPLTNDEFWRLKVTGGRDGTILLQDSEMTATHLRWPLYSSPPSRVFFCQDGTLTRFSMTWGGPGTGFIYDGSFTPKDWAFIRFVVI